MPKKNVWIHQIKPNRITKIVVTGKNREIQNFARASTAVLLGCLFWLLLPAPQHLCLNVLQVGQCLEPTIELEEKTTLIGLVVPSRHLSKTHCFPCIFLCNFKNTVGALREFGFHAFCRIVQLIGWLTMAQRGQDLALWECVA
jgi:hypothetical protein